MKKFLHSLVILFYGLFWVNSDPQIKYFRNDVDVYKHSSQGIGNVYTIVCDVKNKELQEELICGMDAKLSINKFIIYSGYIDLIPGDKKEVSLICLDLIMENKIPILQTDHIWQGKCFGNYASTSEILLNQNINMDNTSENVFYSIEFNDQVKFNITSPPFSSNEYTRINTTNLNVTSAHIHRHGVYFDNTVGEFCDDDEMTSIMSIKFVNFKNVYYSRIKNSDVYMSSDFFTMFGFKNQYSMDDLENCWNFYLLNGDLMDVTRAVYIDEDSFPPKV